MLTDSAAQAQDKAVINRETERIRTRRWVTGIWLACIVIAALHSWAGRYAMNPDGVTYLDMSDAYRAGNWKAAVDRHRNPGYSWLLMPVLALTQTAPDIEFPAVHALNFLIFLAALFCFHFLLTGIIQSSPKLGFSKPAFLALGYSIFLWSSLSLITLELVTPDLCVATIVYAATGMLVRVRKGDDRWAFFLVLGLILGTGYLVKTALLGVAPLTAILCAAAIGQLRRAIPRVLLVAAGFALVAGPWLYILSVAKGGFSFGDSGKLAYAFMVQDVPNFHWHGVPAGNGMPVHPDRQIYSHPNVYEFGWPILATYPPNYGYSYWAEGLVVRSDVRAHLRRVARSLREYAALFLNPLSGVTSILILLCLVGGRERSRFQDLAQQWRLLVLALYAFGSYGQVWVEWRYLGPYVTLLLIGILCAVRLPEFDRRQLVTDAAAAVIVLTLGFQTATLTYSMLRGRDSDLDHLRVAHRLRDLQIAPGTPVAVIGDGNAGYWARIARVRIVAEIPLNIWDPRTHVPEMSDVEVFWAAGAAEKAAVMSKLVQTGARVAIARDVPSGAGSAGWQNISGTPYSFYPLQ